jgi:hypothetical protein
MSPDGQLLAEADRQGDIRIWEIGSGQVVYRLTGHVGAINAVAFTPDGRQLVTGSEDTTGMVWSLDPADTDRFVVSAVDHEVSSRLWDDLVSSDAARAYRAGWRLSHQPQQAVALLREYLKPAPAPNEQKVHQMVASLDDDQFAVREKASRDLEAMGDSIESVLRQELKEARSLEVRSRLESLIAVIQAGTLLGMVPERRAVAVLERIGNREAQYVLAMLAGGASGARVTQSAQAALGRLRTKAPEARP